MKEKKKKQYYYLELLCYVTVSPETGARLLRYQGQFGVNARSNPSAGNMCSREQWYHYTLRGSGLVQKL